MATCGQITASSGNTVTVTIIGDGSTGDGATCPVVYLTGTDYAAMQVPKLDQQAATEILGAFLLLFAIVFSFRMLRKLIDEVDVPGGDEKH